jgi:WXG100 family type VII secretion target
VSFSYSVDLDLARHVVASLASVEGQLFDVVADLHWRIDHLHELWLGTAAAAHLEAHRGWEASYGEMHDALVAMRRVVHAASENYDAAGTDNAAMWGQVR